MSQNPLFPTSDSDQIASESAAVRLIRAKVTRAYGQEPDAIQELQEVAEASQRELSKHQVYMQQLSASGKSLADIQTQWHHYYVTLPDDEKRQVWQEFYSANQHTPYQKLFQQQQDAKTPPVIQPVPIAQPMPPVSSAPTVVVANHQPSPAPARTKLVRPDTGALKAKLLHTVSGGGKLKVKHHLQSLLFGVGTGLVVMLLLLFSFFNEFVIAPFIQPSRTVSATPIILSDTAALASGAPQVIIPKINVQIPLDFTLQTNNEAAIETALENGVVHYPSTVKPGQNGNAAFFGHSSNNIFNPGKYKFAFVLLRTLTTGDVFYITFNGQAYAYQVFAREVVSPDQVGVLNDTKGKTATATLITCDPPGTSANRLVVWGEQISPSVSGNSAEAPAAVVTQSPQQIASNGPTLWRRLVHSIAFWQ